VEEPDPLHPEKSVIVVASADDPESVKLAAHYAEMRGVPRANIIALPGVDPAETTTWSAFIDTVFQPLQDELVRRKWIDAIPTELKDAMGRRKYAMSGHSLSYLVVCRGIPLRIEHDEKRWVPFPPLSDRQQFRTNASAVDSELSLMAFRNYPLAAFIPNPLYDLNPRSTFQERRVIKVSRLDGPTYAEAAALVDHAVEAERYGLIGRAYVDIGGPYKGGDAWFEQAAKSMESANFDVTVDRNGNTFEATDCFDAPALYFGWYATDLNGPFWAPDFRFPPGAVALHLHSFSATTLHNPKKGWTGPLVAHGVTATVGNVNEPYLEYTHQPQILVRSLLAGESWGQAVYRSLRGLSWQGVAIGDPLYRPFAKSFSAQWQARDQLPDSLYPYVVLREIHRLDRGGREDEARTLAFASMEQRPSLPLALKCAELADAAKDQAETRRFAEWIVSHSDFSSSELRLVDLAGLLLTRNGGADTAAKLYLKLLALPGPRHEFRRLFVDHGIKAAQAAQDRKAEAELKQEYERMTGQNKNAGSGKTAAGAGNQ
jgi:uncharacterized protein (TIGR03790 family)